MKHYPDYPTANDGAEALLTSFSSVTLLDPAEAAAMETSFLRMALDAAQMGAWKIDLQEQRIYWSHQHHELFDIDEDSPENPFEKIIARVHPDDRERATREFWTAVETRQPLRQEYRVVWRDGSVRWIATRGTVHIGEQGWPTFVYGVNWDITDKKRAVEELARREQELEKTERLFQALTVNIPQMVWTTDADGYAETVNQRWRAYTGQSAEEAIGSGWLNAVHRDDRARVAKEWMSALRDGTEYRTEYRVRGTDGQYRWFMVCGVPVRDESGKIANWFGTSTDITDRKQVEEAQERGEREARLRAAELSAILDAVPAVTFIAHDPQAREMTSNRVAYEFLGLPEGVNSSKSAPENATAFTVLKDGRELEADELPVQRAAASGTAVRNVELQVRRADGTMGDLFGHAVPMLDEDGKSRGAVGAFVDVTELKRAQRERDQSDARFRRLFDSDVIGFLISALDGRCIESNDAFLGMVGYTREEMAAGKVRWLDMTPPEYLPLDYAGVAEVNERGSCRPYEKEYIRKDGTRLPILLGYTNLAGTSDHYISFVLDLSAQKRAERDARDRQQQFMALADSLPQMVYVLDEQRAPMYCNRPFTEYTGLTLDAVRNADWNEVRRQIVHPDDVERMQRAWAHSFATGEVYQCEVRIRRRDGKYRAFLSRGIPVRDDAGRVVRWVASAMDVHDHKLAEEALRRSDKLAAAGRLASSIAHEINNPLQAVTSLVYLLGQEALLSTHGRTLLRTAEQELKRMSHTVTQALRFTRSSREPVDADMRELADSALELFRNRLSSANIEIERMYDVTRTVRCSADEIRQVIAVLVSNARDAMMHGGRLIVRLREGRSSASADSGVWVTVADTGTGIAPEMRGRIFEPFVTTKEATGTGLGLWVASEILRRHDGHIRVRSKAGAGTVARVFLPRPEVSADGA